MIGGGKWVGIWGGDYTVKMARFWEWFYTMHHFAPKALTDFRWSYTLSPLPYHTANGKTEPAVMVILRVDSRWERTQAVTVCSRTSSSRPPVATCDAYVDVTIRANVVARTEKVERYVDSFTSFYFHLWEATPITIVSPKINNSLIVAFLCTYLSLAWVVHGRYNESTLAYQQ